MRAKKNRDRSSPAAHGLPDAGRDRAPIIARLLGQPAPADADAPADAPEPAPPPARRRPPLLGPPPPRARPRGRPRPRGDPARLRRPDRPRRYDPQHIYGGLLTVLLRLVFLLYAEDRGLMPGEPILAGDQIAANLRLLGRAPQRTPELLLRSPARVFAGATLLAFSRADLTSLQLLGPPPAGATLTLAEFPGYDPDADPLGPRRQLLDDYLAGRPDRPNIDFDAIRRKLPAL